MVRNDKLSKGAVQDILFAMVPFMSIGAANVPHAQRLRYVYEDYNKRGSTLRVTADSDYEPGTSALREGAVDAAHLQHPVFLGTRRHGAVIVAPNVF